MAWIPVLPEPPLDPPHEPLLDDADALGALPAPQPPVAVTTAEPDEAEVQSLQTEELVEIVTAAAGVVYVEEVQSAQVSVVLLVA